MTHIPSTTVLSRFGVESCSLPLSLPHDNDPSSNSVCFLLYIQRDVQYDHTPLYLLRDTRELWGVDAGIRLHIEIGMV